MVRKGCGQKRVWSEKGVVDLSPISAVVRFLAGSATAVGFSFNNEMYQQKDGVAMGSPRGPALANIFVGFHEERLFDYDQKPGVYFRYQNRG